MFITAMNKKLELKAINWVLQYISKFVTIIGIYKGLRMSSMQIGGHLGVIFNRMCQTNGHIHK